jgi:glycosyltransferase involved in cell wall biosynthesis
VPRVSIIVPAYNAEEHLGETLASVEAQTYVDWEVIVADDGSTDRTVDVASRFGDRFTVLRGGPSNEGPAAARNRALAVASGELVALLDADDLWLPGYLDRMVQSFDEGRARGLRVGIVTCNARILGPNGYLPRTYMELQGFPDDVTVGEMLRINTVFGAALFPRALLDEVGVFCPEIFGTEDYDLWLRIIELGYRVALVREPLAIYRLGERSVSTNVARMARALQLTYERALERGRLTPDEQRAAQRQHRLQRALEQVGLLLVERREGGRPYARAARNIPLFLRVAVENPDRWAVAVRVLAGRASPLGQLAR